MSYCILVTRIFRGSRFLAQFGLAIYLAFLTSMQAQTRPSAPANAPVAQHASGTFDVKVTPQNPDSDVAKAANFGRLTIDKTFHGDLEATSKGEMLAAHTEVKGSAGYVAMERVTGTLKGRQGTFVLQHSGTMTGGVPTMSVTVVPDSGTGELKGLSGKMNIISAPDGKHSYQFDYTINESVKNTLPGK